MKLGQHAQLELSRSILHPIHRPRMTGPAPADLLSSSGSGLPPGLEFIPSLSGADPDFGTIWS